MSANVDSFPTHIHISLMPEGTRELIDMFINVEHGFIVNGSLKAGRVLRFTTLKRVN